MYDLFIVFHRPGPSFERFQDHPRNAQGCGGKPWRRDVPPTTNNCSNWGNLVTNYSRTVDIKWQATSHKKITDLKNRGNISQLEWTHTHPTHTTTGGSPLGRAWQMNSDVEMNGLVLLDMSDMKFLDWHVCLPCLIAKKHPLNNCWAIWLKLGKWDHNASSSWQSFKLWL